MGDGWTEAWLSRERSTHLVQRAIDELERDEQVDLTIYCCAEDYPHGALVADRPLILPFAVVVAFIQALSEGRRLPIRVGLVAASGGRQLETRRALWSQQQWSERLSLDVELDEHDPAAAAGRLALRHPDVAIYWGYGIGLAPNDPPGLLSTFQSLFGQSVLLPHRLSVLAASELLR